MQDWGIEVPEELSGRLSILQMDFIKYRIQKIVSLAGYQINQDHTQKSEDEMTFVDIV